MLSKPPNSPCSTCFMPAQSLCAGFSNNEGLGTSPILFVAEALGEAELREGLPLRPQAPSGSTFERALSQLGRQRSEFTVTNILRGRPKNNKLAGEWYEQKAIQQCRPYLDDTINTLRPRVIVSMGDVAFKTLTGLGGRGMEISKVRGYFVWSERYQTYVLPTFHPSFIVRGGFKLFPIFRSDIKKAIEVGEGKREVPRVGNYTTVQSIGDLQPLLNAIQADPSILIAYDIETTGKTSRGVEEDTMLSIVRGDDDYNRVLRSAAGEIVDEDAREDSESQELERTSGIRAMGIAEIIAQYQNSEIESIQFSLAPGTGFFIPYRSEFLPAISTILASPNPKAGHNAWIFDNPILRRNGFQINGIVNDSMWMWHHSQPDAPASLQSVGSFYRCYGPWKHLASGNPELYGCLDVDAVQRIMSQLPDELRVQGLFESYERFVRKFHPILERMQDRGLKIDLDRRKVFEEEVERDCERIEGEIQVSVPKELQGRHPVEGFKVWPAELRELVSHRLERANSYIPKKKDHLTKFTQLHEETQMIIIEEAKTAYPQYRWAKFSSPEEPTGAIRPFETVPFNPRSPQQLKRYLEIKKIKVPIALDGKETTAKKELERLAKKTGDPVLSNILELRKQQKVISTYVRGWIVGRDHKVHTTYTFAPATWQLSSRGPNIQNVPKHGEFAKRFRQCIVASPGHVLMEADWKSFHAQTLALEAGDGDYLRLAKLDVHSFVAAFLLHLPEADKLLEKPDEELLDYFKWFKSDPTRKAVRDEKAKRAILGIGFGLGKRKLYNLNMESFQSEAEAGQIIQMVFRLFPKILEFQSEIRKKAHQQGYLISRWGAIRRFNSVYVWNAKYEKWDSGDDSERAIAFLPANDAFGKVREAMITLEQEGLNERYGLVNTVHDSLVFDCPKPLLEEAMMRVKQIMESPATVLTHPVIAPEGLRCEVEISVGEDWGNLKEIKL